MASRLSQLATFPNPSDPIDYPVENIYALGNMRTNKAGSDFEVPILLTVAGIASGTSANAITPLLLPRGVYQINCILLLQATLGNTLTKTMITIEDVIFGVVYTAENNATTTIESFTPINATYVSDGINTLLIKAKCNTSASTWGISATQTQSQLQIVRVA
jgi:hypothetical protein